MTFLDGLWCEYRKIECKWYCCGRLPIVQSRCPFHPRKQSSYKGLLWLLQHQLYGRSRNVRAILCSQVSLASATHRPATSLSLLIQDSCIPRFCTAAATPVDVTKMNLFCIRTTQSTPGTSHMLTMVGSCMHVCTYVRSRCVHTYVRMYVRMCMLCFTYIHANVRTYVCVNTYSNCVCVYVYP